MIIPVQIANPGELATVRVGDVPISRRLAGLSSAFRPHQNIISPTVAASLPTFLEIVHLPSFDFDLPPREGSFVPHDPGYGQHESSDQRAFRLFAAIT